MNAKHVFDQMSDEQFEKYNEELAEIDVVVEIDHVEFSAISLGLLGLGALAPTSGSPQQMATQVALRYFDDVNTTEVATNDPDLCTGIAELELNGFEYSFCMAAIEFLAAANQDSPFGELAERALEEFEDTTNDGGEQVNALLEEAKGMAENA